MNERPPFHLAFAVSNLAAAEEFYVELFGAEIGRRTAAWLDILLWGHQLTLHLQPSECVALDQQGKRHFGVILPWPEWETLSATVRASGRPFLSPPAVTRAGTPQEQAKFLLADPSNNVIEVKAYRDFDAVFGATRR
jgi:extradiol dioxygenase family protein